jgi:hypothetical protein
MKQIMLKFFFARSGSHGKLNKGSIFVEMLDGFLNNKGLLSPLA